MQFRIADTFTDSLGKLTGDEQKAVKTTAFDLQLNPAAPGLQFHKLNAARDPNFWSVRVSRGIRVIVHRTSDGLLLCYVDHHDKAYKWAERRKLETHPKTGAAQLVEIRETVQEITVPKYVEDEGLPAQKPALFEHMEDEELLKYGVPAEWIGDVRAADEDTLLALADHLPSEAAEALLELATGGQPEMPQPQIPGGDPFEHPDAQRRFRIMSDAEELAQALDYPWEKWTVFLHPAQRQIVKRDYNGPARVSGSAGTGKTIVALHRAVHLAQENSEARVLLTTFSETLANALRTKLRRLINNKPRLGERIEVHAIDTVADRLYRSENSSVTVASSADIQSLLDEARKESDLVKFSRRFLLGEWEDVVDAWQLASWEDYRDVKRLGRKTRLSEGQRSTLWSCFEKVKLGLEERGLATRAEMFTSLAASLRERRHRSFDFAVIDEAQDISVAQLRFLAAMGGDRPNALFFAGDLGQRIFQTPFSWKSLGVDIRGRSQTLRINYRTSHQIRRQADRLLGPEVADVDGNVDNRRGTVSVFNGPNPKIQTFGTAELESNAVGQWLKGLEKDSVLPHEIGIFVRSENELERAQAAVQSAGFTFKVLDEHVETAHGHCSVSTMHLAKGLEFRAVAVMACDDEVLPSQERIESVSDDADLGRGLRYGAPSTIRGVHPALAITFSLPACRRNLSFSTI